MTGGDASSHSASEDSGKITHSLARARAWIVMRLNGRLRVQPQQPLQQVIRIFMFMNSFLGIFFFLQLHSPKYNPIALSIN
jgi:hypothetical protein